MQGANINEYRETFDVDLGGILGAGLLSVFRVTFGEDGRWLWLELDPSIMGGERPERQRDAEPPIPTPPPADPAPPAKAPEKKPDTPAKPSPPAAPKSPSAPPAPGAAKTEAKPESKGAAR
jgi:hypothetical protein